MSEPSQRYPFQDDVDIAHYLLVLARKWWLILAVGGLAALVAFLMTRIDSEPTYQASSLVAITGQRYYTQFDPYSKVEIEPLQYPNLPFTAFLQLAETDELVSRVIAASDELSPSTSVGQIQGMLSAAATSDRSVIRLTATSSDPDVSISLVNTWTEEYVRYINDLYGHMDSDAAFFASEVDNAQQTLTDAEQQVVDFQTGGATQLAEAKLQAARNLYTAYLNKRNRLQLLQTDVQFLRSQLENTPAGQPISYAQSLSIIKLELESLSSTSQLPLTTLSSATSDVFTDSSTGSDVSPNMPESQLETTYLPDESTFTFQLPDIAELDAQPAEAQIETLTQFDAAITEHLGEVETHLTSLEAQVNEMEGQVQALELRSQALRSQLEVAQEHYQLVLQKQQQTDLLASSSEGIATTASLASTAASITQSNRRMLVAVAAGGGIIIAIFLILAVAYIRDYAAANRAARAK